MARRDVWAGSGNIRSGRAGRRAGVMCAKELRPYLQQKGTATNLMTHTDKIPHKIVINVTNKEINQGIKKKDRSTDIKDKN